MGNKIYELEPSAGHSVKPPKAKAKVQRKNEQPTLFFVQNNPSNLMAKILSVFGFIFISTFLMKKIDGLSTIVWVSNLVRPDLPSRVRCLG